MWHYTDGNIGGLMSNALLILILILSWLAGRLLARIILRQLLAPRFTFEELKRLFVSREVKVLSEQECKARRKIAERDMEVTLHTTHLHVLKSPLIAEYTLEKTSGDELITVRDLNHKNMQIALRSGEVIQVEHGGVHDRSDFTNEEIHILTNLCAIIRKHAKGPSFSYQ
jgi:hypothetical protein